MMQRYFLVSLLAVATTSFSMNDLQQSVANTNGRKNRVMVEQEMTESILTAYCNGEEQCIASEEAACMVICLIEAVTTGAKCLL